MIDKNKAEDFVDKAVDFVNESGEKATNYAKEHELDKKAGHVAKSIEDGVTSAFNLVKRAFNKE